MSSMDYLVIADNEVQTTAYDHASAQLMAKRWSEGRYDEAKVIYLPNRTVQGIWYKGERLS